MKYSNSSSRIIYDAITNTLVGDSGTITSDTADNVFSYFLRNVDKLVLKDIDFVNNTYLPFIL